MKTYTYTESEHTAALAQSDIGRRYKITVKVSERRKKTIGFKLDGETIEVTVPADTPPKFLVDTLTKNRQKLAGLMVKGRQYKPEYAVKELVPGAGFLWMGSNARLRLTDTGRTCESERLNGLWLLLPRKAAERRDASLIIDWYCREGTAWAQRVAPALWERIAPGKPMPEITAARMGNGRWGVYEYQAGVKHRVRLNWQTFQLPTPMVRHILTHELIHASHPGDKHGPKFWRAFHRVDAGARQDSARMDRSTEARSIWKGALRTDEA